jgi:hypothetical protein
MKTRLYIGIFVLTVLLLALGRTIYDGLAFIDSLARRPAPGPA